MSKAGLGSISTHAGSEEEGTTMVAGLSWYLIIWSILKSGSASATWQNRSAVASIHAMPSV